MKEKRSFMRSRADAVPGVLTLGGRSLNVLFEDLSLIGARVRTEGGVLPPVGTDGILRLDAEDGSFVVSCKVVGLDGSDHYRIQFSGYSEGSLNNLLILLRRFSRNSYDPQQDLPRLTIEVS